MENTITHDEERATCTDCGRWEYLSKGGQIRHSTRCDFPKAQYQVVATEAPKARIDNRLRSGNGLSSDELLEAVQKGYLSQSDAMNTDF